MPTLQDVVNKVDGLATKVTDQISDFKVEITKQIGDFAAVTNQRFDDVENRLDATETLYTQMQAVLEERFIKMDKIGGKIDVFEKDMKQIKITLGYIKRTTMTAYTFVASHEERISRLETKCV